jgi:signal transduction histidine kinase
MNDRRQEFEELFRVALAEWLSGAGEIALSRAYELGRMAILHGISILDVVDLHRQAAAASPRDAARAAEFLAEALSPFEMTHRGFKEANARLDRMNRELVEKNEELDRIAKELEAFSYSVSHDLRAPLRSIDGFSQALLEDQLERLDDSGKDYLQRVRAAAQRMGTLIDALLGLSRIGRADFVRETIDLASIARAVVDELRQADPERSVDVVVQDGLVVEADDRLMRIVLQNLLGNAWKFTAKKEGAHIEVGALGVVYHVRDDGAGFDPTYADRLFTPFQRLHSPGDFPGTGIGLATVRRIVQRHGGRIWAEGAVGRGATFSFTLGPGGRP